jgi:hypothetical protein
MTHSAEASLKTWRQVFPAWVGLAALAILLIVGTLTAPRLLAQTSALRDWQAAAGGKMAFDVSVKQNKSDDGGTRPAFA